MTFDFSEQTLQMQRIARGQGEELHITWRGKILQMTSAQKPNSKNLVRKYNC